MIEMVAEVLCFIESIDLIQRVCLVLTAKWYDAFFAESF